MSQRKNHPASRPVLLTARVCSLLRLLATALLLIVALRFDQAQAQAQTGPAKQSFVPADQLEAIFERSPNGILLPREEFQQLLKKAQQAEAGKSDAPVAIVKRSASYDVQQLHRHAVIRLQLEMEQFTDEWLLINIPVGNLQVEQATIDGESAAVATQSHQPGILYLAHRKAGRFTLELTMSTALGTVGSDRVAAFRIVPDVAATLKVACPKDRQLQFNDLKLERPAPIEQPTEYLIPGGSFDQVRLKWTSRQQQTDSQTLVFARTDAQLQLSRDNIRWMSDTRVSVFGTAINQLTARVPSQLEVTAVESAGLESWKLEDDPDVAGVTRVVLNYRQPFTEDRLIKLSAVSALKGDGASARLPTLELIDVSSHTGRLYVQHEDQLRLMATVGGGIRHLGTNTDSGSSPAGEIFDFWLQNFTLSVAVKPRERELFAEVNSSLSIADTVATLRCESTIESLNAPLFELPLKLPAGWQITSVTDENDATLKWRNGSVADEIVVEPAAPTAAGGLFSVTVLLSKSIDDPTDLQTLELPVVTALDTLLVGGTYEVSGASDLTVSPVEINGLSPIGADDGKVLFETQGTTYSGQLTVLRKPVRLSSRAVIRSWMDTRQKTVDAVITVDVLNGTTRTLQLELPEDLGAEIRFSVVSITKVPGCDDQQAPSSLSIIEQNAEAAANGVRKFNLTFDKRFVGAVTLKTTIQQPKTNDTVLSAALVGLTGAIRQHGLVVFEAYPEQQLTAPTDLAESGLQIADAGLVEAPPAASGRRVALVYRYVQPRYSLQLTESRFDTQAVPSAVCQQIANVSVLSDTGTIQRSCTTLFRSVGVQTLRFTLPNAEQTYLWSTILNGEAVEVRRDADDYLVAIPANSNQSQHVLEILFETAVAENSLLGKTEQQSIQLAIDSEQGKASPIDILEQTWDLRYPSTAMLLNHDGGFYPQRSLEQPGWLHQVSSMLRLPKTKDFVVRGIPLAVILLILFVVTTLVVQRRWKTLACLCLLGILAVPLILGSKSSYSQATKEVASVDEPLASPAPNASLGDEMQFEPGLMGDSNLDLSIQQDYSPGLQQNAEGAMNLNAQGRMPGASAGGLGGGGFGGGMGAMGGGYGAGGANVPQDAEGGVLSEKMNNVQPDNPGIETDELAAPQIVIQGNTIGGSADEEVGLSPTARDNSNNEAWYNIPNTPAKPAGSARLSVRAEIANPDEYRSMQFRSIGATQGAGVLQVTVQPRSRMNAIRLIVASVIALLCLAMNKVRVTQKIAVAVCLLLFAAAAVPLVPNEWQPAVDGVACGVVSGLLIWVVLGCCRRMQRWCECCRAGSFLSLVTSKRAKTAGLLILASTLAATVGADEVSKSTRPEIVMPYTPGQPELLADRVFLPQDEFLKLYRLAYPDELETAEVPATSQVVAAFYKSTDRRQVQGVNWSQSFTVRYVIRSYSNQPVEIPLPIGNVAVTSARLGDADAILVATSHVINTPPSADADSNAAPVQQQAMPQPSQQLQQILLPSKPAIASVSDYSVRIPSAGLHLLDVVFEVSATIENSVGKLTLPLQPVSVGTILFELPDEQVEAKINGRSNAFRTDGKTVTIPIASASATTIEWKPKATQTVSDTIFHATVNSALVMDDTGLVLKSALAINCRQGQIPEVQLTIPPGYAVQSVEGNDIAGWAVSENDATSLTVLFKQPVDGQADIQLTLFQRTVFSIEDLKIAVPIPIVVGASRDSGSVTILAGRELEVRVDSLSGVSQVNAADVAVPDMVDNTLRKVLAWRYTRHPVAVAVRVFRTAEKLKITSLNGVQLEQQRQLWTTLISASISGAPRRRLEIELPADYLALDVTANDMADWYYTESADESSGTRILNIQFQTAKLGTISAVIQGQTSRNQDQLTAKIVAPEVLGADESSTSVSIWLDASSEIATAVAEGWKRIGRDTAVNAEILKLQPDAPDISFTSDNIAPPPIALSLRQAEASLGAESVTVTTVTDTSVELMLALKWKISGAATRTVSFMLPAELSDVYDFRVPGLRQLQKTEQGDTVKFTVHLQQPASENLFVLGMGTVPLPDSRQVLPRAPQFVMDDNGANKVSSQSHFWVIVNQSAGLLETVDPATDGKDVGADEIKTQIPAELLEQSVAIRRLRSDQPNSAWQLKFAERQKVAPAVVALAAHVTIVAQDSTWRSLHTLQLRNESRQFLPVILPTDSRVLFCLVKGHPTRVVTRTEGDQLLHLIPIPQSGEISAPFDVQFALAGQLASLSLEIAGNSVQIPCPVIPEYRDFPDYGVTISRNTWQVYVPEEWDASIENDPRQTNVITATLEDLEDVRLMCSVDNIKSMISAANANGTNSNDVRVFQELQKQQLQLQQSFGNKSETEAERTQALQEAEVLLGRQYGGGGQVDGQGGRSMGFMDLFSSGKMSNNIYLDQQEATQNRFNNSNSIQLFDNNGSSKTIVGSGSSKFNFQLPALIDNPQSLGKGLKGQTTPSDKAKSTAPVEKGSGSKLLERRELNNRAQSLRLIEKNNQPVADPFSNDTPAFGSRQLTFPNQAATPRPNAPGINNGATLNLQGEVNVQSMQDLGIVVLQGNQADVDEVAAVIEDLDRQSQLVAGQNQGLLSLQFDIPQGGIRHDFVRTGGNASLTLNVRSRRTVGLGAGIAWSIACLIVAIVLLRGASKGASSLLLRTLLLVSFIGLAGVFCTANPLRDVSYVVCVIAAICCCGIIVARSFWKPVSVA